MKPRARSVYFSIFIQPLPRARMVAPGIRISNEHPSPQDVRRTLSPEKGAGLDFCQRFQGPGPSVNTVRMASQPAKTPAPTIRAIHRYPVKGLIPEPLPQTLLAVRQTVPFDRMYAI